jgi:hypothetical protein
MDARHKVGPPCILRHDMGILALRGY